MIQEVILTVFVVMNAALAKTKDVYFAVGAPLVLDPGPIDYPITSITWKHKGNIATEWIKDVVPVDDYGDFKDRTKLDLKTAVLTVNAAKSSDEGEFTVEINNRVLPVGYKAAELQKVPKPEVVLRPLTCQKDSPNCTLSCEGNLQRPELVSYFWKKGNGEWEKSEKEINIINDEKTKGVETFSCKMQNPVSEEESEAFNNLFYQAASSNGGAIVGGVFGVLLLIALGVVGYFTKDKILAMVRRNQDGKDDGGRNENGETDQLKRNNLDR